MYFKWHFCLVMCHLDSNEMTTVGMKLEGSDFMDWIRQHIQLCYRMKTRICGKILFCGSCDAANNRQTNQPIAARFNKPFSASFPVSETNSPLGSRGEIVMFESLIALEMKTSKVNGKGYLGVCQGVRWCKRNTNKCIVCLSDFNSENKYL